MKIAIFPDEYLPESTRVHAKMLHELALELKSLGNDVVVITPGEPKQQALLSVCFLDGLEVWRFRSGRLRGRGKVLRAINETLLSYKAWRAIRHKVENEPFDICVNYSPSIFFGPLMSWFKRRYSSYVYLILRDIFPKWAIDEGLIKEKSLVAKYFSYFEQLNYRNSDQIGLMSKSTLEHFRSLYPTYRNLCIMPNWANHELHSNFISGDDIRQTFNLKGKVIFFYGGNIGHAQGIHNLLNLAREMEGVKGTHFLFVGQGDCVNQLLDYCQEYKLTNVTYSPPVSQIYYEKILSQVDVGLVSLAASHTVNHYPGKTLGYMKFSLPILACLNKGNDLVNLINESGSGFGHYCNDASSLLESASQLAINAKLRLSMGRESRKLLLDNFSTRNAAKRILASFASD
ncbi:glycosyltransferase family 4 protein [Vibrio sinaloensis]|uniref:glycosyltransferase family 4 protein n=1 Tax=Photobacterium sp. (strain ATCC 43367) TaxID=379097 RepID=UPI0022AF82B6|nr:glycosyltransferase family 4 protein [Vibrio sinaloensis]MCZ4294809.1 glycosyltransferase family 4 protein [Vibrio sinaloensis]